MKYVNVINSKRIIDRELRAAIYDERRKFISQSEKIIKLT